MACNLCLENVLAILGKVDPVKLPARRIRRVAIAELDKPSHPDVLAVVFRNNNSSSSSSGGGGGGGDGVSKMKAP